GPSLRREFDPAVADCGLQGTATSPSSTAKTDDEKSPLTRAAGVWPQPRAGGKHPPAAARPGAAFSIDGLAMGCQAAQGEPPDPMRPPLRRSAPRARRPAGKGRGGRLAF